MWQSYPLYDSNFSTKTESKITTVRLKCNFTQILGLNLVKCFTK